MLKTTGALKFSFARIKIAHEVHGTALLIEVHYSNQIIFDDKIDIKKKK